MSWSTPVAGIAGTVITAAWSTANVVNPLTWLRQLTGNADPPGTGYVVTSDSSSTTSWKTGTTAGASIFGAAPVIVTGSTMTGALQIANATEIRLSEGSGFPRYALRMVADAVEIGNPNNNMVFRGAQLNIPNNIYLGLMEASGFVRSFLRMSSGDIAQLGNSNSPLQIIGTTVTINGDTPATAASVAAINSVPAGLVAIWTTASAPTGWVFHTDLNDRFPLGAGSTYTLNATGGAATHEHTIDHTHAATATGSPGSGSIQSGSGSTANPGNHTHTIPALGAGNSGTTNHLPPYRVVNYIRKS
jgi:hypothetical protein